jgi:hypothetical protein
MRKNSSMSIGSIGIQTILPKTGTPQQPQQQLPANENDRDADDSAAAQAAPPPPPAGMGTMIDKTA